MKCTACEVELREGDVFCHQCGARVAGGGPNDASTRDSTRASSAFRDAANERQKDNEEEEEKMWEGTYSPKAMLGSWIGGALAAILVGVIAVFFADPLMAIGICLLAALLIFGALGCVLLFRRMNINYELTNQRFIHKSGILRRVTDRIEVIDMDDVTFEQGLVQRFLGVGKIRITSSDRSHPELVMNGIEDVQRVAGLIDDVRRKERRRRGLHIEAL